MKPIENADDVPEQLTLDLGAGERKEKGLLFDDEDLIYDRVDELMKSRQFDELNNWIALLPDPSVDLALTVLTATLPAISKLPARERLLETEAKDFEN